MTKQAGGNSDILDFTLSRVRSRLNMIIYSCFSASVTVFCLVFKVHHPRKTFSKGIKGTFGSFLKFKSTASPAAAAVSSMKLLVSWIPSGQMRYKTSLERNREVCRSLPRGTSHQAISIIAVLLMVLCLEIRLPKDPLPVKEKIKALSISKDNVSK